MAAQVQTTRQPEMNELPQAGPDAVAGTTGPSKTRRKQAMLALQKLGEKLLELPVEHWQRLALPEALCDALARARTISAHEARRRQLQYIGRLMRQVDAEAIERTLASLHGRGRASATLLHRCEQWRDRLLADDEALTEFLAAYPTTDAQALRATIRAARRELASARPPRQARLLYRALHVQLTTIAGADVTSTETS